MQDLEEDGGDDSLDSYLTNTDQKLANLVMGEKVLLASERNLDSQVEGEQSE